MPVTDTPRLISIAEAAEIAGVSRQTISAWLDSKKLTPYTRGLGGPRKVDADELARKLQFQPPAPPSQSEPDPPA